MTDPIPSQREGLEEKLRVHIERLNDQRLREHHSIRMLHRVNESGRCRCCRETHPCPTLRIIDGVAV